MGMSCSTDGAFALGEDVWLIDLPPHQVRFFGGLLVCRGSSLLRLKSAHFDEKAKKLTFNAEDATVLCIGTTTRTVVIGNSRAALQHCTSYSDRHCLCPGDREFLSSWTKLCPSM